jgi:hypothetical protein
LLVSYGLDQGFEWTAAFIGFPTAGANLLDEVGENLVSFGEMLEGGFAHGGERTGRAGVEIRV